MTFSFFSYSHSGLLAALLNSAGVGLVNSLGSGIPGGQSSTPNLNPPNQIDPSSIERAYAALGLTYQGNQIPQQQQQTNLSNQGLQGQPGMRNLNIGLFDATCHVFEYVYEINPHLELKILLHLFL